MKRLFDADDIEANIKLQAEYIRLTYKADDEVLFLVITDGGRRFAKSIMGHYTGAYKSCEVSVKRTYKDRVDFSPVIINSGGMSIDDFKDQHVVILDDILDIGKTMLEVINFVNKYDPASINFATLIDKDNCYLPLVAIGDPLFCTRDQWVYGFGMDYEGNNRDLNDIYAA